MKKDNRNLVENPTKKSLVLFTSLWFVGVVLLVMATTDLFTESFFQRKNGMIWLLMIFSTMTIVKVHLNYWSTKSKNA